MLKLCYNSHIFCLIQFQTRQSVAVQRDGASRLTKKYPLYTHTSLHSGHFFFSRSKGPMLTSQESFSVLFTQIISMKQNRFPNRALEIFQKHLIRTVKCGLILTGDLKRLSSIPYDIRQKKDY